MEFFTIHIMALKEKRSTEHALFDLQNKLSVIVILMKDCSHVVNSFT